MCKVAVIYQSKYGTTEKYAKWIAQELACDLYERKKVKADQLMDYETIIYGGGLYAGSVLGFDLITKNFTLFQEKHVILFTCGLADPLDCENTDHIKSDLKKLMSEEMQERIKVFHLRGGMDYSKLGLIDKSMMAMLRKMVSRKDEKALRSEDKEMLATYGQVVDFTDRATLGPLLDYVRAL